MHIHPIHASQLAKFAAVGTPAGETEAVHDYLVEMVARGAMRPEWCFVVDDNDHWLGRVAYWTLPRVGIPLDLVLLDLPWDGAYFRLGTRLLQETIPVVRAAGAHDIGHVVGSPPQWMQWQDHVEQRNHLLTHLGFRVERETLRFELKPGGMQPALRNRLRFRNLTEIDEAVFVDAIQQVSAGTFDQRIQHERSTSGPAGAAHALLAVLRDMEYDPRWWQLAYDADGALVGLVAPTRAPTFSTIGYIGVVPEQRGRGYVDDLLAQGTATLIAASDSTIRTDTDVANVPMANAFRRAGYKQFATRREYRLDATIQLSVTTST